MISKSECEIIFRFSLMFPFILYSRLNNLFFSISGYEFEARAESEAYIIKLYGKFMHGVIIYIE